MKEIFQSKTFWMILIILLLAVFVYPPFIEKRWRYERSWDWFFSSHMEIDLKMLLVEAIMAILLSIGIFLIPLKKIGIVLRNSFEMFLLLLRKPGLFKTIFSRKRFWLIFGLISSVVLIFPPLFIEVDKKIYRDWGFLFRTPIILTLDESSDMATLREAKNRERLPKGEELLGPRPRTLWEIYKEGALEELKKRGSKYKSAKEIHKKFYGDKDFGRFALEMGLDINEIIKEIEEGGRMKIDTIILLSELVIGFLLSFLITLLPLGFLRNRVNNRA